MRTVAEINADYSKTVTELGLLAIQQAELPRRMDELRAKVFQLRAEHGQSDAVERQVAARAVAAENSLAAESALPKAEVTN